MAALESGLDIRNDVQPGRHGDIAIRRYRPRTGFDGRTLVWVHGGAFSHGGLDQLESHAVAAAVAQRGVEVIAVDYHLVPAWRWFRDPPAGPLPGTRFPVPVHDVVDVFQAVRASRKEVALGGASAGACLSAAAAHLLAEDGHDGPSELVLAYGSFHAELPPLPRDVRNRITGIYSLVQFRAATVRRFHWNYAGSREAMNLPAAFVGGHDLSRMPPAILIDADRDTLRSSGQAFAAELAAAGIGGRSPHRPRFHSRIPRSPEHAPLRRGNRAHSRPTRDKDHLIRARETEPGTSRSQFRSLCDW